MNRPTWFCYITKQLAGTVVFKGQMRLYVMTLVVSTMVHLGSADSSDTACTTIRGTVLKVCNDSSLTANITTGTSLLKEYSTMMQSCNKDLPAACSKILTENRNRSDAMASDCSQRIVCFFNISSEEELGDCTETDTGINIPIITKIGQAGRGFGFYVWSWLQSFIGHDKNDSSQDTRAIEVLCVPDDDIHSLKEDVQGENFTLIYLGDFPDEDDEGWLNSTCTVKGSGINLTALDIFLSGDNQNCSEEQYYVTASYQMNGQADWISSFPDEVRLSNRSIAENLSVITLTYFHNYTKGSGCRPVNVWWQMVSDSPFRVSCEVSPSPDDAVSHTSPPNPSAITGIPGGQGESSPHNKSQNEQPKEQTNGTNQYPVPLVAGVASAGVLLIIVVLIGVCLCKRRSKRSTEKSTLSEAWRHDGPNDDHNDGGIHNTPEQLELENTGKPHDESVTYYNCPAGKGDNQEQTNQKSNDTSETAASDEIDTQSDIYVNDAAACRQLGRTGQKNYDNLKMVTTKMSGAKPYLEEDDPYNTLYDSRIVPGQKDPAPVKIPNGTELQNESPGMSSSGVDNMEMVENDMYKSYESDTSLQKTESEHRGEEARGKVPHPDIDYQDNDLYNSFDDSTV